MFVANDIITVDLLNETNNVEVSNGSTSCNGGSGSWQDWDGYWYSNVDTGEEMGWLGAQGGWNVFNFGGSDTTLYKYENGNWVQKVRKDGHSGYGNSNADQYVDSYGPGSYKCHCAAKYAHHLNAKATNAKHNNEQNKSLALLLNTMEIETSQVDFISGAGEIITLDNLNSRQIYTI